MTFCRNDDITVLREIKYRIKDLYSDIRRIPRWLKKCFEYSIFLWNDFDFDSHYLLRLMQFKLKRIRNRIEKDNIIVATDRVSKQIKYAEFLIDRIMKDDYFPEAQQEIEEIFGETKWNFSPAPEFPGCQHLTFTHSKCSTPAEEEQADQVRMALYKRQEAQLAEDYHRLFRHLEKYIQRWWN